MVDVWNCLRRIINGMDDFEGFLLLMAVILFSLLFVRVIIAVLMGTWTLFS